MRGRQAGRSQCTEDSQCGAGKDHAGRAREDGARDVAPARAQGHAPTDFALSAGDYDCARCRNIRSSRMRHLRRFFCRTICTAEVYESDGQLCEEEIAP